MTVGVTKVRRPQVTFTVRGDRARLDFERDTSLQKGLVVPMDVGDLENDLGQRLITWSVVNLIQGELDIPGVEEGESTSPARQTEADPVGPELDRHIEVFDTEDDLMDSHV